MDHFTELVWLLGDEAEFGDLREYERYGIPHLIKLSEKYGYAAEAVAKHLADEQH